MLLFRGLARAGYITMQRKVVTVMSIVVPLTINRDQTRRVYIAPGMMNHTIIVPLWRNADT